MGTNDLPSPNGAVAVAASAGGVEATSAFVAELPGDLAAAVLIVLHVPPTGSSALPSVLAKASRLPAVHPVDGVTLRPGVIYVAPPGRQMAVTGNRVQVFSGAPEHGHRPAADVLFRSVAEHFGTRAAGIVLTGTMDDGAAGLKAIGTAGGLTLVQDPDEAAFSGMPMAAIKAAESGIVAPVSELAKRLCLWVTELPDRPEHGPPGADVGQGPEPDLTDLTCPDCGSGIWQHAGSVARRFRCRVGHSFSANELVVSNQTALESALWAAIVALEERADVSSAIAERLTASGRPRRIERYRKDSLESRKRARVLRDLLADLVQGASISHA